MNGLIKTQTNEQGEILVSGRDLYEFLEIGAKYSDWMKRMMEYGFEENVDIAVFHKNVKDDTAFGGYRKLTDHVLKVNVAKEIAMIQKNDKGKQARKYFIELEEKWNSPEMIMKRALEFANKRVKEMEEKFELQAPKVFFAEAVGEADNTISVNCLAKLIAQNGHSIGQKRLFLWLRENGYLIVKPGNDYNTPKQQYIEQGLFRIKEGVTVTSNGTKVSKTTMVTGKGQQYFVNKFIN